MEIVEVDMQIIRWKISMYTLYTYSIMYIVLITNWIKISWSNAFLKTKTEIKIKYYKIKYYITKKAKNK